MIAVDKKIAAIFAKAFDSCQRFRQDCHHSVKHHCQPIGTTC
jgi:hypothetical protein